MNMFRFLSFPAAVLLVSLFLVSAAFSQDAPSTALGIDEYNRENYEEALQLLTQSRVTEGRTPLNDYFSGLCLKQMGNYADAAALLVSAIQAEPPVKDAVADLVGILVSMEKADEALKWIGWAEKEQIKAQEISLQKGLILAKKGRAVEARAAFIAAKNGNQENDQIIDQQIALSYQAEGNTTEARAAYKAIATRYPGTDVAKFAEEYEQRMSLADQAKHWTLVISGNYVYDDNVQLGNDRSAPLTPDSALNQSLRFEYDHTLSSAWSSNIQYAFQNSNYRRYYGFDMLNHGLTASVTHSGQTFLTTLPFNITHFALDYRNNSLQYSFKPSETIIFAPQHLGMITLGVTRREMSLPPIGPETFTTGNIYNGQVSYIYLFAEGQGMATVRGEIFYEDTLGTENRNLGSRAGFDLLLPLPLGKETKLSLSAEGAWQDYRESVDDRRDTTVTASATLKKRICDYFYLNAQYSLTRAMSNVDANDYRKNTYTAGFELRF